jgi:hypothetical protein
MPNNIDEEFLNSVAIMDDLRSMPNITADEINRTITGMLIHNAIQRRRERVPEKQVRKQIKAQVEECKIQKEEIIQNIKEKRNNINNPIEFLEI